MRRLHVPDPCTADWDAMKGGDRRRFCDQCSKHVHDLSAMTPTEAEGLLRQGDVCVRFACDSEGNVVHAPRRRPAARWVALGAALLGATPALASTAIRPPEPRTTEATEATAPQPGLIERMVRRLQDYLAEEIVITNAPVIMGGVEAEPVRPPPPPVAMMGKVALPPPPPTVPPPPSPPARTGVIPEVEEALRQR